MVKAMLYLNGNKDQNKLEKWIDDLGLRMIRLSDKVQRLKKVRFLGTMPYIVKLKENYSRYDHTLYVAKIADAIAKQMNTSQEFRRLLVLAALLHDIGHLPFSHASEVFYRQTWGRYHTAHGSRLIYHLVKFLKLSGQSTLALDVNFANDLLMGRQILNNEFENMLFYQTFHGPLSADTIDGIIRASESVGLEFDDPSKLVSSFRRDQNDIFILSDYLDYIYNFLKLKKDVYSNFVYSVKGMAAEAMLTRSLELAFVDYTEKDDFISLNDESTIEKIKYSAKAYQLFKDLESGNLFYSLKEYTPEKYKLISDIYNYCSSDTDDPIVAKKSLEKEIIKQLGATPEQAILHSSIRLLFWEDIIYQPELFSSALSLKDIAKKFSTRKVFGQNIDLFVEKKLLPRVASLKIPTKIKIAPKEPNNRRTNAVEQHAGAYMTPEKVARFIIEWAIKSDISSVLDPSSGQGVFIKEAHSRLIALGIHPKESPKRIYGIETDYSRWKDSLSNWEGGVIPYTNQIINANFFDHITREYIKKFDVIVGNPPYIRFHRFTGESRERALELTKRLTGVSLSKRTSSWAPYLLCCIHLLHDDGKLGMVLPFELLTTDYAAPVRTYLKERFKSLIFVFFKENIFSEQQGVLLLLASNDEPYGHFKMLVDDTEEILTEENLRNVCTPIVESEWLATKWTEILVSNQKILELIKDIYQRRSVIKLREVAKASIGLVTGKNSFFILSRDEIEKNNIDEKWTLPIIKKASHIKGALFTKDDFNKIIENNEKCYLLYVPPSADINAEKELNKYLEAGKREAVDQKYKCRSRWPWYSVPMQPVPDAFMTYMSGEQVRFVLNQHKIHSTNTIHNIYFKSGLSPDKQKALITSFYCSIAQLSMELTGRSYGGGVLKLEIGEAENMLIPNILNESSNTIKKLSNYLIRIDKELRNGGLTRELIASIDTLILKGILKLSQRKCQQIRNEFERLKKRRLL